MTKKPATSYEILKESNKILEGKLNAALLANHNLKQIEQLKKLGLSVKPVLMKNNQISYVIQSPLQRYYAKDDIDLGLYAAGQRYQLDYELMHRDPFSSKVIMDGSSINEKGGKRHEKSLSTKQLRASSNILQIKKMLRMLSTQKCNYEKLISYVLESEFSLNKINQLTKSHRLTLKKNIIKALEIIQKYYKVDVLHLKADQLKKIH
tara:strand:- start:13887 stop:14507 length:621 start_codon:yes stop_codon:yes gene_type:complete